MARQFGTMGREWARGYPAVIGAAAILMVAACGRDAPLDPRGRALPPDVPSALLNPLCTGTGGQTHAGGTISTAVTWPASGNPHTVTGTVTVGTGGQLTIEPGAIVCFDRFAGLNSSGGRLVAQGLAASPIVFTARDPALGWFGISLQGVPATPSSITNARVEYTGLNSGGIASFGHPVAIDSTVVRQVGWGVRLGGRTSSFSRSRVDTTTNRQSAAVTLGDSTTFEQSVVLRAAGIGIDVEGTAAVRLLGGRVEGSGGVGIRALNQNGASSGDFPVRVTGGGSYPLEINVAVLRRMYKLSSYQDSLKGNARDTLLIMGGTLNASVSVRIGLPWHVKAPITIGAGGLLRGLSASRVVLDPDVTITATDGGYVKLNGTRMNPVVLTADDPARGWGGLLLQGTPSVASSISNTRLEYVAYDYVALTATGSHPVAVDSAVFRQNGRAVSLLTAGSRLSRSRVDTTLSSFGPAVELAADAVLESTLIRGSSKHGLVIRSPSVQVLSCEVRESVSHGIVTDGPAPVHNCNLVNNLGVGLNNPDPSVTVDATNNWWGDVGGPTAPAGDGVAGLVTYGPWRTTPVALPYVP